MLRGIAWPVARDDLAAPVVLAAPVATFRAAVLAFAFGFAVTFAFAFAMCLLLSWVASVRPV
jgi:hypothetical protein